MILKTVTVAGLLLVIWSSALSQEQVFTFEVPDSLSFKETSIVIHTRGATGEDSRADTMIAFYDRLFLKTPVGYERLSGADSIIVRSGGQRVGNPVSDLMSKIKTRLILDSDGHAIAIEGYDNILDHLFIEDTAAAASIRKTLVPSALGEKDISSWNQVIDPLVGKSLKLGVMVYYRDTVPFNATEKFDYFTIQEVTDTFRVDGVLSARVYFHSDTEISRLAERRQTSEAELKELFHDTLFVEGKEPRSINSQRVCQVVLEVNTMKLLGLTVKTEVYVLIQDEMGNPTVAGLLENRMHQFEYATPQINR